MYGNQFLAIWNVTEKAIRCSSTEEQRIRRLKHILLNTRQNNANYLVYKCVQNKTEAHEYSSCGRRHRRLASNCTNVGTQKN